MSELDLVILKRYDGGVYIDDGNAYVVVEQSRIKVLAETLMSFVKEAGQ